MPNDNLRIYPFGGVGEFGKNMMIYAIGREAIIVDCGMGFPEPGQHGVDIVIPDISAIEALDLDIIAMVLTHGHEDHIGAVPYLLPVFDCPVYGTPMTLSLVREKLSETNYQSSDIHLLPEDGRLGIGLFEIEAIPVTHSMMDAVSIAIHTPQGVVIHTGDFKFDPSPIDGRVTALNRFSALGDAGVRMLISDSTNATQPGSGLSERSVAPALRQAVNGCSGKVLVTTFSSNMFRVQQIIDVAVESGRRVALAGRSLERNMSLTLALGKVNVPPGKLINLKQVRDIPAHEVLIITTGSQGESRAAMARIAQGNHPLVKLDEKDLVIFSSSMIPGNERMIAGLFNHIYRRGARVLHSGQAPLHVSGHAQAHELKTMMQLTRPEFLYPVHGEYRQLVEHAKLGEASRIPKENILMAENGQSIELSDNGAALGETFHAGAVFVDHVNRDEIDDLVVRDRKVLAREGIVTAIVVVSRFEGTVVSDPVLVTRGFVLDDDGESDLFHEGAAMLKKHLEQLGQEFLSDEDAAKEEIRIILRRYFRKKTGKRPMVLPVLLGV